MHLNQENIQKYPELRSHAEFRLAQINAFNAAEKRIAQDSGLAVNAGLPSQFWLDVDRAVVDTAQTVAGYDIVEWLAARPLNIGKTVSSHIVNSDIADEVIVTMDGHGKHGFDNLDYDTDGDPIPMFVSGYGANWRHVEGLRSEGLDIIRDSAVAKSYKHNNKLASYILNGDTGVTVDGKAGQGLKNHRNTIKVDLTVAGINLTTADAADVATFFTTGAMGLALRTNLLNPGSVTYWVSPEIMANLSKPAISNGLIVGSTMDQLRIFLGGAEIRQSFGLSGNELLAIVNSERYVRKLVGMATTTMPVPRTMPIDNYNFKLVSGLGLSVIKDGSGKSGVIYAANLT